ncbi:MAG TPA: DNA cytosine methyltransferase [Allocoleopsis sp.]
MKVLDLFSGIGGFAVAAQWLGLETVAFCEIDPYCQSQLNLLFPDVPVFADVRTLTADSLRARNIDPDRIDAICAGFPCQDISGANPNGRGLEGERSGLFFEVVRLLREVRPRFVLLENVPAMLTKHRGRVMGAVLYELSQGGYDAEWQTISAFSLGATHTRERVFIVAYPNSLRWRDGSSDYAKNGIYRYPQWQHTEDIRTWNQWERWLESFHSTGNWFDAPAGVSGMDARVPCWSHRMRALGNSVSPQQAAIAWNRIRHIEQLMSTFTTA